MRSRIDFSQLARSVAGEMSRRYLERDVTFEVADGLEATADPCLLETVLENLLDNAWKYTRKTEAPVVKIGAVQSEEGLVFFARDNGVGFDMLYATRIFQPFERLHSAAEYDGSGIGLAIVKRITFC